MLIKLYVWQLDDTHSGFKVERPKIHPVSKKEQSRYSKSRKTFIVIIHILLNTVFIGNYYVVSSKMLILWSPAILEIHFKLLVFASLQSIKSNAFLPSILLVQKKNHTTKPINNDMTLKPDHLHRECVKWNSYAKITCKTIMWKRFPWIECIDWWEKCQMFNAILRSLIDVIHCLQVFCFFFWETEHIDRM